MREKPRLSLRFLDWFWVTCSAIIVFNSSSFALTNLLVNGSFENSGPSGPSGWSSSSISLIGGQGTAVDGTHYVGVGGYLEQEIPTVPGEDYVVTFAYAQPTLPNVLWDGLPVTNATPYSVFSAAWWYAFVHVHATSNVSTLRFTSGQLDDAAVVWAREPIQIITQPESKSAFEGGTVSLSIQASGPQGLFYQWFFQGLPISGAAGRTFGTSPLQLSHAGQYYVLVSNLWNSVTSAPAQLQVNPPPTAPEFIVQPFGDVCPVGYASSLSAFAVGAAPLSYRWSKDGAPVTDGTNASLIFSPVQASHGGTYTLLVSNQFGTAMSLPAILTTTNSAGGGSVSFNLYTNSAAITDIDGVTRLSGSAFKAQVYAGATPGILRPVGASLNFPVGTYAGYPGSSFGFSRTIPDVPAGQFAYVQIRAWESTTGSSYEQARASGGKYGFSAVYQVLVSGSQRAQTTPFSLRAGEPFFRTGFLSAGQATPEGAGQFLLSGQVGARYLIETKLPPNNWIPFLILTNEAGTAVFIGTNQAAGSIQFYRARLLD